MALVYLGISLPNSLKNPLQGLMKFCTAEELRKTKISHDQYCAFLTEIKKLEFIDEIALVSTCNRFELLVLLDNELNREAKIAELTKTVKEQTKSEADFNCLINDDAKMQVLRTYAGLNSGLIAEDEICTQINAGFRQSAQMGFAGQKFLSLLDEAIELREIVDKNIYQDYKVSYCDVALKKCLDKFNILPRDLTEQQKIVVLGSGSTAKKSCISLLKLGAQKESITVVHRISKSSVQIENIKAVPELRDINFVRSKDGYRADKVKDILADADLVVFGIDTSSPVVEFAESYAAKIVDFNSNASCSFEAGFDFRNYVSNIEADSFVRYYASEQAEKPEFVNKIKLAETLIQGYISSEDKAMDLLELVS